MSTYTDASLIVTPNAKKTGKLYSLKGADLDVVRATTATYVGSDGLIKTALANEVRFDYTNGSCPSILVEPQRTNLLLRSEEFDNAYWLKESAGLTANQTTAPDGTNTADLIVDNTNLTVHGFRNNTGIILTNSVHTYSIFVKDNGRRFINLSFNTVGSNYTSGLIADLQNGTITQIFGVGILSSSIISFGNDGWYKISYSAIFNSTSYPYFALSNSSNGLTSSGRLIYVGNGTGVFVWGA